MIGDRQEIQAAIDSYPAHVERLLDIEADPYNVMSLTEIYASRVQQLLDLQAEGFTHAEWRWDDWHGVNRWHGFKFRTARVTGQGLTIDRVKAYLPARWTVIGVEGDGETIEAIHIQGEDFAGWTFEDYIEPRLASGLMFAKEVT